MDCPSCGHDNIPGQDLCEHCGLDLAGLDVGAWGVDPDDPVLTTPLSELALKEPLILAPGEPAIRAIDMMKRRREGCVFLVDDDELVGVLTERDVSARLVRRGRNPDDTRAEEVMTPNPVRLRSEDPLAWALHRMGVDGHRHLAVTRADRLIGFLSIRTVLEALSRV